MAVSDESDRTSAGFQSCLDPATQRQAKLGMDLDTLKRKFSFLAEYSDAFINATGVDVLIKAETASQKLMKFDKECKAEDKLFQNREALTNNPAIIPGGQDNRLDLLHPTGKVHRRCWSAATLHLQHGQHRPRWVGLSKRLGEAPQSSQPLAVDKDVLDEQLHVEVQVS